MRTADGKLNVVGDRVRERRRLLRMTQDQLCARLADVSGGAWIASAADIYKIEDGRRSVHDLEVLALASALSCDPTWLLTGEPGRR